MPRHMDPALRARLDSLLMATSPLVRVADLRAIGVSRGEISHLTREGGGWQRVYPGVWATVSGELTRLQRIRAGLLYAQREAVLTGVEALRLRGVRGLRPNPVIQLLIPHSTSRQRQLDLVLERTTRVPERSQVDGIPVAGSARAAIDACRMLEASDEVRHLIGCVVRSRRATVAQLLSELEQAPTQGTSLVREALGAAAAGVRGAEESRLRQRMLAAGLPEPLWNVHLYDRQGRWVAYVDGFLEGIAFEMQSRAYHLYIDRWEPDVARVSRLNSYSVMVQLATPRFLRRSWHEFESDVRRALANGVGARAQLVVGPPPPWWGERAA